jgi:glycosyltransferase involved in cell wall biosynthesis
MSDNPLVSIIVRTKDRPKLLRKALESIASQTYRPIEVVLVNDGGCDLDIELLASALGDVSLNYIRLGMNTGRAYAGNIGIENAKGVYIGFLDDDDEFYPEHVVTLVTFLEQSDYKVAYTDAQMIAQGYAPEEGRIRDFTSENIFSEDFDFDKLVFENYIPFMSLLFRSSVLTDSGGIDGNFELYEDWDLLIRIGERYPFYHIKKVTAKYNQWSRDLQISQTVKDPYFLRQCYLNIVKKHFEKYTPVRIHNYMAHFAGTRQELKRKDEYLAEHLEKKDAEIANLQKELSDRNARVKVLETALGNKETYITDLKSSFEELATSLKELDMSIEEKDSLILAMRDTKGWRLLEKYRRARNYFLPAQSPIRRKLGLFKRGARTLFNDGLKVFIHKLNKRFLFDKSVKRIAIPIEICEPPAMIPVDAPIDSRISIVIPTKNAGDGFDYTLRKIVRQEGVRDIELIIIDSGSSDGTVEISRRYTQNVYQIPPEEFHHARTRNRGAEKATGDVLVFFVQDAIPVSGQWLYNLVSPICKGKISAASPKQIPRSDADLFACWATWGHNVYMGYDKDYIVGASVFKDFDKMDAQQKRSVAGLNNVCLGIKKSIFDSYKFESGYAEDFELGLRLVKDGHPIMFQSSNAVIHSHTRPSVYFLRRGYIDTIYLWKNLGIAARGLPVGSVLEAVSYLYSVLRMHVFTLKKSSDQGKDPEILINLLLTGMAKSMEVRHSLRKDIKGDFLLDNFFGEIQPKRHEEIASEIFFAYKADLLSFAAFMKSFNTVADLGADFIGSLYKFFANTAGVYLGANTSERIDSLQGRI